MNQYNKAKLLLYVLIILGLTNTSHAWTPPTQAYPQNTSIVPINTDTSSQVKSGSLWAYFFLDSGSLRSTGTSVVGTTSSMSTSLKFLSGGKFGAQEYCNINGQGCQTASTLKSMFNNSYVSPWYSITVPFDIGMSTSDILVYVEGIQGTSGYNAHQVGYGVDKYRDTRSGTVDKAGGFSWTKSIYQPSTLYIRGGTFQGDYREPANYRKLAAWKINRSESQDTVTHNDTLVDLPAGSIVAFDLSSCPSGWSAYTTVQGKFIRGATSPSDVGSVGGSSTQTLSYANIPSHTHTYQYLSTDAGIGDGGSKLFSRLQSTYTTTASGYEGSASPASFNIIPSYYSLLFCKKN